ncbi:MAG: hypothetical protein AAF591_14420 [Verrucomicrobiota bacterium]
MLLEMYSNQQLIGAAPVRIAPSRVSFIVEVQYFHPVDRVCEVDVQHGRFSFAVTSDGHELMVDLAQEELPILQREFGDTDTIGITLREFLAATWESVC